MKTKPVRTNQKVSPVLKVVIVLFLIMITCFTVGGVLIGISIPTILEQKYLKEYAINETRDFSGINNLDINTVSSDVTFFESESPSLIVKFHGTVKGNENMKLPELVTEKDGDTLSIRIRYPNEVFHFGVNIENSSLDVYLPIGFNGSVKTNTVSGNLRIKNRDLKDFEFDSTSGDLDANGLNTDNFKSATVSGNSIISGITGKTSIESVSGDISIDEEVLNSGIDMNTVSGNIDMVLPQNSSVSLEYDTISGNLGNTFLQNIDSKEGPGEKKYAGIKDSGKYDIKVTTVSGDLSIR